MYINNYLEIVYIKSEIQQSVDYTVISKSLNLEHCASGSLSPMPGIEHIACFIIAFAHYMYVMSSMQSRSVGMKQNGTPTGIFQMKTEFVIVLLAVNGKSVVAVVNL